MSDLRIRIRSLADSALVTLLENLSEADLTRLTRWEADFARSAAAGARANGGWSWKQRRIAREILIKLCESYRDVPLSAVRSDSGLRTLFDG